MKRTLLNRRNALLRGNASRTGLALLALVLVVVLLRIFFPAALLDASAPLFRSSNAISASIGDFFNGFDNSAALARERDTLASENMALARQNGILTAKVADLETLLGSEQVFAPGIVAGVLARPPESPYDTLIVAAGSGAGVAVGDSVWADGGTPLGTIAAVSANAARVLLYSAPGVTTGGWVGTARTPVQLLGAGGGAFTAQVSRSASTTVGDAVYMEGPGALPIGSVASVGGDASSPLVTLAVAPAVNLFSISYVLITPARVAGL